LGLSVYIDKAVLGERLGSTILEDLLRRPTTDAPVLGTVKLVETMYVWWERRELLKEKLWQDWLGQRLPYMQ
jgi:hypothetical protein